MASNQKRFEVCGAKLLSGDGAKPEDFAMEGAVVTLDQVNTIGKTKSFSATFQWDLDERKGAFLADSKQEIYSGSSVYGRFLTNRRYLSEDRSGEFIWTEYDASTAAGAGFDASELACPASDGSKALVMSLAAIATALSFLAF